mmetsp:Transcript_33391/g.34022  ORF Transcript_33391/g.34022 Transcript_33391/m.34022 type:complete len:188 (-) Transcript_33391:94-657(-)|eukprot:CAMPEP_0182419476 /NCGR_PEP_ID=MMETSP1167-20130531/3933_1 /TAXON_ID=2988 /ORGANISM="Mallomonas Sp, Strain CCMP3275" /LENGTH=187 /DNA_ID=CAMNT_0024594431 /DNA_START=141 /DNA_END=704 /DNA_ORIENTATION=-
MISKIILVMTTVLMKTKIILSKKPVGVSKISLSIRLNNSPKSSTYDATIQHLWRENAGLGLPIILDSGDKKTGNGLRREVRPIGLRERITSASYPDRFEYTIENPSLLIYPVTYHKGYFYFEEMKSVPSERESKSNLNSGSGCRLVWDVEYVPMRLMGPIVVFITNTIQKLYLSALAKYMDSETKPE